MKRPTTISTHTTSQQVLRLMKHTAEANIRHIDRRPTAEEVKMYKAPTEAILLFFAALNIAISDVRDELEAAGLYRHAVKRNLNAAERIIFSAYPALYNKLCAVESVMTRQAYDYWVLQVSDAVDDTILLEPPKRSYNIALALARLVVDLNDNIGRFAVAEALPLHHVVTYLKRIDCITDHHIDMIIAMRLRRMMDDSQKVGGEG